MRYARKRLETDEEDRAYRFFLTEEVRIISCVLAGAFGGDGINKTLYDFMDEIEEKKSAIPSARTGEEIIDYVKNGLHKLADRK